MYIRRLFANYCRAAVAAVLALVFVLSHAVPALADTPFRGYSYNHWGVLVPAPAAYVPLRAFTAMDIDPDLGTFVDPSDIHVCPYDNMLVVDTGNHRVIVFDAGLNLIREINGFYQDGTWETFSRPNGVFVTQHQEVFIADTLNERIVVLDWYDNFIREITAPDVEGLEDDFVFRPLHVVVNRGGLTHVIVQHVFEGIMTFDTSGEFVGYFGTIEVGFNFIEVFWRFFMTDTQIARQNRFIPTEFQSMALDEYNFVFTTNLEPWAGTDQVMRLNPRGEDVLFNLNDNVSISGDLNFRTVGSMAGPSSFIDIIARPNGMYSTLDSVRGRVYTYDSEGNLLYVFSGIGTIAGMAHRPVAIEAIGDDILVLDAFHNRIIQFTPTEYGALINEAIAMRYHGNEAGAYYAWRRLTALDENFQLAWAGIGRSALAAGDNAAAMYYLRRGMDMRHFSIAFRRHRLDIMQDVMPTALTVGAVLVAAYIVFRLFKRFTPKKVVDA